MPAEQGGAATAAAEREAELIRRVLQGERELFYQLIQPYERALFVTALSILQNESDAEDAAQDGVVKALRHLHTFRGEAKFSTWLLRIVMNEGRMRLRRRREVQLDALTASQDDESEHYEPLLLADWREIPSDVVERQEVRQLIAEALGALPPKYREVVMLRDVQQMSTEEAARVLGITPDLVKVRLLRARLRMRDLLAPKLAGTVGGKGGRRKWF
jgi:RNA polymerase sigma-70 factor (ECF subfamily)